MLGLRMDREQAIQQTGELCSSRYADAEVVFLAGSIVRGEGTKYSDLDLVVVYKNLTAARRESFQFNGTPVEAFIHDPETLNYFFTEVDRPSGCPSLPQMVLEGIEIPMRTEFSERLKRIANSVIEQGPPPWSGSEMKNKRYQITDLIDDIREPKSIDELIATGAKLYELIADFYFRSNQAWSAKGKTIPRRLRQVDPEFAKRYSSAFENLFKLGDASSVIGLAAEAMNQCGGFLFDGHQLEAPSSWRRPAK